MADVPTPTNNSVTLWIARLAGGDQVAARRIFDCYYDRLRALASRHLAKLPPQIADDEGAVNSALRSFYSGAGAGRFPDLDDRDSLYKLLATITLRKVAKQYRKHYAAKAGGGNRPELGLDLSFVEDRKLGPEDLTIFQQECQRLLDHLDDETLKQIALWMMEGLSNRDIADKLEVHIRSVQRKTNLILGMLAERAESESV